MIIDRNSILKDQYYTKTIFTNITTKPSAPVATSWFISGHNGYTLKENPRRKPMIAVGSRLPAWSLALMSARDGDSLHSASLGGKKTIMEFWIKNCGYCMAAFPEIKELQEKYGKEINVVSINAYEERKEVAFFYDREKPAYKMLYGGEKLANQLGIYGYPAVIVLDENGVVVYAGSGFEKAGLVKAVGK
jgi:thiol-disulfide isomerase/thioredoxin